MKIKKKSIIIPAFALLIGASLVGSISGTVAWYQFSTIAHAAYVGASGGKSGNLHIRFAGQGEDKWVSRLTFEDVDAFLGEVGSELAPVTYGDELAANSPLDDNVKFYSNPILGRGPYSKWQEASTKNYIILPLEIRFAEQEGDNVNNVARNIYLSELLVEPHTANDEDITEAIRIHLHADGEGEKDNLLSINGEEIDISSKLDLDNDGEVDQAYPDDDKYGFKGGQLEDVTYGADGKKQSANAIDDMLVQIADDLSLSGASDEKVIGRTQDNGVLKLDVTIWVEGWQPLENKQLWDSKFIDNQFHIGFEFAVDPTEE